MMLFDLNINGPNTEGRTAQLIPVELFTAVMAKIELIVTKKHEQQRIVQEYQLQAMEEDRRKRLGEEQKSFGRLCIKFISSVHANQCPYRQILEFLQ
jgi:hypothetical protein